MGILIEEEMTHDRHEEHHRDPVLFNREKNLAGVESGEDEQGAAVSEDINSRPVEAPDMGDRCAHPQDLVARAVLETVTKAH